MSHERSPEADLEALAAATERDLPTLAHTERTLRAARPDLSGDTAMKTRKPLFLTAAALVAVGATLLFPVPYSRTVGFDMEMRSPDGRVVVVRLPVKTADAAERRAKAVRKRGLEVVLVPRYERTWGTVYAMARDKVLRVDVTTDGKTDAEIEDEIRAQLAASGWKPGTVQVTRKDGETTVAIGADDGDGRAIQIVGTPEGGRLEVQAGDIDDRREPGMTDAQLREKILKQFRDRGMEAEVTVEGDRVQIRATR